MTECATCGQMTADDRDFCGSCGAYLRWDEPEAEAQPDGAPTAVLQLAPEETPTAVLPVEPLPVVPADAVRVSLVRPEDPGAGAEPPSVRVEAGGRVRLTGIVFNQSGIVDGYDLRIAGLDPAWWTIAPARVDLVPFGAADGVAEQRVEVHLHPPRAAAAEAREWEIALVAQSRTQDRDAGAGRASLTIEPYEQLECRVRPQTVRDRRSGQLAVPLRNLGNAPVHVRLDGEDDEGMVRFDFAPPALTLGPGQDGVAQVTVTARGPVSGAPCHRRLTIAAEGARERVERQATFIQEPTIKRSYRFAWRIALTLLAAAALIGGAFAKWDGAGDAGICTHGDSGCLSYDRFVAQASDRTPTPPDVGSLQNLFAAATSIGVLALLLGLLALAGARRGTVTWLAGALAVLLALAMFVSIHAGGVGVWLVLLGGISAIAAGALARP